MSAGENDRPSKRSDPTPCSTSTRYCIAGLQARPPDWRFCIGPQSTPFQSKSQLEDAIRDELSEAGVVQQDKKDKVTLMSLKPGSADDGSNPESIEWRR